MAHHLVKWLHLISIKLLDLLRLLSEKAIRSIRIPDGLGRFVINPTNVSINTLVVTWNRVFAEVIDTITPQGPLQSALEDLRK